MKFKNVNVVRITPASEFLQFSFKKACLHLRYFLCLRTQSEYHAHSNSRGGEGVVNGGIFTTPPMV